MELRTDQILNCVGIVIVIGSSRISPWNLMPRPELQLLSLQDCARCSLSLKVQCQSEPPGHL